MIISRFPQQAVHRPAFTYTGNYEVIDEEGGYKIRLLSSGVFTPGADMLVDLFAVGGGSGGFAGKYSSGSKEKTASEAAHTYQTYQYGGGGSGGYTDTEKNATLEAGVEYAVTIGAGGAGGTGQAEPGAGGETSLGGIISANGGYAARYKSRYSTGDVWHVLTNPSYTGCTGGCGGGEGHQYITKRYQSGNTGRSSRAGGKGGSDGSDGKGGTGTFRGEGQLTTTREFGEEGGVLYAGAGGGGWHWEAMQAIDYQGGEGGGGNGCHWNGRANFIAAENGAANTGGGGGGGDKDHAGGSGGSGILIIRNARGE